MVIQEKADVTGIEYLHYRTRAQILRFVTVLMMAPSAELRLHRISADPRGLSSGDTFQSVLMR